MKAQSTPSASIDRICSGVSLERRILKSYCGALTGRRYSVSARRLLLPLACVLGLTFAIPHPAKAEMWSTNQFLLGDQAFIYVMDTNFTVISTQAPCYNPLGSFGGSLDWYPNGDLMVASMFHQIMSVVRFNREGQQMAYYSPGPPFVGNPPQETKLSFNGHDVFATVRLGGGVSPTVRRFGLDPGGAYEYFDFETMGGLAVVSRFDGRHELWFAVHKDTANTVIIFALCPTGEIDKVGTCTLQEPAGYSPPADCHSMTYDPVHHRVLYSSQVDAKIFAVDVESHNLARTYVVPAAHHTNQIDFTGITTGPGGMVVATESYPTQSPYYGYRRVGLSVWDADGSNYRFINLEGTIYLDKANGIYPKNITWTGNSPALMEPHQMRVESGGVIRNGDTTPAASDGTDFGLAKPARDIVTNTFKIWNLSATNLELGSVTLSGPNASDFSVALSPASPVEPSNYATLQITFHPSASGTRSATVTFTNSSSLNNPFSFAIQGWGLGEGDVDRDFITSANQSVNSLATQPDGKILAGGGFTSINSVTRNFFARLQTDGSSDAAFNTAGSGANSNVYTAAIQPDGKTIIGGAFTSVNGATRNRLARLNADGSLDTLTFNINDSVNGIALQPDGKIFVAGDFTTVNGVTRNRLARLNSNGALDATFNPGTGVNGSVYSLALQPDGKVLIGGDFSSLNGSPRYNLARVNSNGFADSGFFSTIDGPVHTMAIQPDGKIVIGGAFFSVNGLERIYLARLNTNGSVDADFNPAPNGEVLSIALQADGKLLLGGNFTTVLGSNCFHIARLNPNGTLDPALNPGANTNVLAVTLQPDGRILLGGDFTSLGGQPHNRIAQVLNGPATSRLSISNSATVQWFRSGTAPETTRVTFELSTNSGTNWTSLGAGTRIAGGWELTGLSLSSSGILRARAYPVGGYHNGSSSLVETLLTFPAAPLITAITPQPNGAMQISATGSPNLPYVLEATSNLAAAVLWQPIRTNNADVSGNLNFLDTSATNFPQRFYRGRVL